MVVSLQQAKPTSATAALEEIRERAARQQAAAEAKIAALEEELAALE